MEADRPVYSCCQSGCVVAFSWVSDAFAPGGGRRAGKHTAFGDNSYVASSTPPPQKTFPFSLQGSEGGGGCSTKLSLFTQTVLLMF